MTYPTPERFTGVIRSDRLDSLDDMPLRDLKSLPFHNERQHKNNDSRQPIAESVSDTLSSVSIATPGQHFVHLPSPPQNGIAIQDSEFAQVLNAPLLKDYDSFTDATSASALIPEHVSWPPISTNDSQTSTKSIEAWRHDVHLNTDCGPKYMEELPRAVNRRFLSTYDDCVPLPADSHDPTWRPRATSTPATLTKGYSNVPDLRRTRAR